MKKELSDLIKRLKEKWETLKPRLNLKIKEQELKNVQQKMEQEGFWNNALEAKSTAQRAANLQYFVDEWHEISIFLQDAESLIGIANDTELSSLQKDFYDFEKKFEKAETELLLSGQYDQGNVILNLYVGNGGQDAEDFCKILERMYLRFAEEKAWKARLMDESATDAGIKSATLEIKGSHAYGLLQSEHGVHRLIRLSPFNAKNLRQTSFARVEILPELSEKSDFKIDEKDVRIDVFRSSGSGGQSVNTTDSAVRVTYLPLGIMVSCQNERSQLQNKENAIKVLKARLLKLQIEQRAEKIEELRGDLIENSFGSQIRTYTLQPYKLVKDHRTNFEHSNPEKVFDGDLDGFIQSYLRAKK